MRTMLDKEEGKLLWVNWLGAIFFRFGLLTGQSLIHEVPTIWFTSL